MSGDIRIDIVWDDSLAGITILKGILTASKMEYKSKGIEYNEILRCKVTIDDSNGTGSLGFQSFTKGEGFSGEVFESLRESIDSLVRSYHEGYKLVKSVYTWVSSYFYATHSSIIYIRGNKFPEIFSLIDRKRKCEN
jgi:hypothetical protein